MAGRLSIATLGLIVETVLGLAWIGGGIYLGQYLKKKGANLVSKEDIGLLTREVEKVKSEFRVREELVRRRSRVHERLSGAQMPGSGRSSCTSFPCR